MFRRMSRLKAWWQFRVLWRWQLFTHFLRVEIWYKYLANCDHDWEVIDDSFSHEYGTEIIVYQRCTKCDLCCDYEQPDDLFDREYYEER